MNKLLSTYGLTHLPFSKDLSPAEMFRTEQFEEALQSMKAAIEGQTSAVVTGDSGSGKTCLIRALEEDLPAGRYRFHYNPNATVNRRDFYRQISIDLGLDPHSTFAALYLSVNQHIQDLAQQHKLRVILVLDEAHMLPIQVLEQLHVAEPAGEGLEGVDDEALGPAVVGAGVEAVGGVHDARHPGDEAWSLGNRADALIHGATYFRELLRCIGEHRHALRTRTGACMRSCARSHGYTRRSTSANA